jgi:hypothetical protein
MAKFKPIRDKKKTAPSALRAIPCLVIIIGGLALMYLLFVAVLKQN